MRYKHGGDIYRYRNCIDFSSNCNPLGTPASVQNAVIESAGRLQEYPQAENICLCQAIAEYEGVPSDFVVCGNGAAEVIFSLVRAAAPSRALLPAPTFFEYQEALCSIGCDLTYFELTEEQGFSLDERILCDIRPDIDILFICNPNNPTGILTHKDLLLRILRKCRETGTFLVLDECFLDFVKDPQEYTLKEYLSDHPELFILKAFTKRYAMAGVRLGYGLCASGEMMEKIRHMTQPWNVSLPAQAAGMAALKEKDYVKEGRRIVFEELSYLKREFSRLGIRYFPSEANFLFFKGREDLFTECLKKGILIRDCSNYPGLSEGYFRTAVKKHEENVKLIEALETMRHEGEKDG